jgi:fibronectin-binding autotransporter adhesin
MRLLTMTQGTYTAPAPAARRASLAVAISAVLAGAVGVRANAAEIFLQGADGPNESSFTTTTNSWGAGGANDPNHPNADDDYNSNGYLLRTPQVSTPETFAGKSLTIGGGAGGATGVMVLLSGGGAGAAVTVDDLRANNGRLSVSSDTSQTLNGVVTVLAGGLEINGSQANRTIDMGARLRGSGGITVRAIQGAGGTVVFRDATNDYTGNLTVESGAILRQSVSGALSSAGSGVVNVAGTLQLRTGAGEATASTDASINGLTGGGTVTNGNTASTLTIDGDGTTVFSGGISGSQFGITKTGSGSQTFEGDNTYEGETTVQGGRLIAASATALGDTSGGTTIDSAGGTVELAGATTSEPFTLEARVDDSTAHLDATGASSSEIDASGSIKLDDGDDADPAHFNITTNTTTGTGVFTIAADINGTGAAAAEQNLNFGGGADGEGVVSGAVNMDTDATTNLNVSAASWDFSGALSNVDNLNVSGGLATLSNTAKTIGTVDVTGGTLDLATGLTTSNTVTVGPDGALTQTGSNISASQSGGYDVYGTVSLNGSDATITSLTGSGIVQNDDDAGDATNTLTIDTATDQTFSGTLRDGDGVGDDGTLALTKLGTGEQTIGTIDIDGDVNVDAGIVSVSGTTTSGDIDVASGADLSMTGTASTGAITSSGDLDAAAAVTTNGNTVTISAGTADFSAGLNTGTATTTVNDGEAAIAGYTGGTLEVTGGIANMSGTGNFGAANVSGGALNVLSQDALDGSGATNVSSTGRVNIGGTPDFTDIDEIFNLAASGGGVQLSNVANTNTISGAVNLVASTTPGQEQFRIESQSGTLNLDGGVSSSLSGGAEILNLGGAGDGTISALSMTTADSSSVVKDGAGNWTIRGADIDNANEIVSQGGILTLADAADIDGDAIFDLAGGSLNVAGVTGGSSYDAGAFGAFGGDGAFLIQSGQTLTGNGTVTGDMVVAGNLDIGSSFGEMGFGNLDLDGTVAIEVGGPAQNGLFNDLLTVDNLLDIAGASLVFDVVGALTRQAYVFATYGSLLPPTGRFLNDVTNKPDGWSVVYGYGGEDQIALVNDAPPLPAPGPLALIGLGALVWGGLRRRASRDATAS